MQDEVQQVIFDWNDGARGINANEIIQVINLICRERLHLCACNQIVLVGQVQEKTTNCSDFAQQIDAVVIVLFVVGNSPRLKADDLENHM